MGLTHFFRTVSPSLSLCIADKRKEGAPRLLFRHTLFGWDFETNTAGSEVPRTLREGGHRPCVRSISVVPFVFVEVLHPALFEVDADFSIGHETEVLFDPVFIFLFECGEFVRKTQRDLVEKLPR